MIKEIIIFFAAIFPSILPGGSQDHISVIINSLF